VSIESLARPEIVAMKPYSSARKEAPGKGILLNANESPWSLLENAGPENMGPDTNLNRYPDPQPRELVSRLAELYAVNEENVLVTRGSDEGIDLLTRVFCRAGQDAILHCPPTFGMYRIAAQTQGAAIVSVPRSADNGFTLDRQGVLDAVAGDDRIRVIFLTSPNNPTGDAIEPDWLPDLLEATSDRALVVIDEAYAEFCRFPSAAELIDQFENLVVLRTLSKAWAAAGLRCGVVLAQFSVISLLRRIIAPYPLASPVISLACRMLDKKTLERQKRLLDEVALNKARLLRMLEDRPFVIDLWPGEANFVLFRSDRADDLLSFCAARGVILRGYPADPLLSGCIRISVGSDRDLSALESALNAWEAES
jgi:histidinol-phosphate aminotransferase